MVILSLIFAVVLAILHLLIYRLHLAMGNPRSKWLSFAGGISVAYAFVQVMPEISKRQEDMEHELGALQFLNTHLYILALAGLIIFYGLDKVLDRYGETPKDGNKPLEVFQLHVVFFSFYNLVIGYLLATFEEGGILQLSLFFTAMLFHLMAADSALFDQHKTRYVKKGRWLYSSALVVGWLIGHFFHLSDVLVGVFFAFIAGSIILNILKEELPETRKSRFWPFLLGAVLYSSIMVALEALP